MKKVLVLAVAVAVLAPMTAFAQISISLHEDNVGISGLDWSVDGNKITLWEDWTEVGNGFVQIDGLVAFEDYTVCKYVYNNTGVDWDRFSHELLDPDGDQNDIDEDRNNEFWVPDRFSHSNEFDGLSFAQGSGIPRTSTVYTALGVDELGTRDFLDFSDGNVANGGSDLFTFGLREHGGGQQPFLLAQRPNEQAVPEPGTLFLIGGGLAALAARRRRR